MLFKQVLRFDGTWRTYQQRVLDRSDKYIKDGKIHIVAAPGSGKTTLGIELIRRLDKPTLILTPSITIREQWIDRIKTGFMKEGVVAEDYLSQDIKNPKPITAITYQSLHSAMRQLKAAEAERPEPEEETDDTVVMKKEQVDYSGFDLLTTVKNAGFEVVCLDECHHLRSEWWKALGEFMEKTGKKTVISLTATPPYDSTPAGWKNYMDLCGEIDEEITVPELVKEGSLCPHQDFIYFNYPTREEMESIDHFRQQVKEEMERLLADREFAGIIASHAGLENKESVQEAFYERPEYLTAVLSYLDAMQIPYPAEYKKSFGEKGIPQINEQYMQILLQGFLYEDTALYPEVEAQQEKLEEHLKHLGLIHKKKVCLQMDEKLEKMLITSKGKVESIKEIVKSEYQALGKDLRMLILTDYIKKEFLKSIGDMEKSTDMLGVIPFFEMLRRNNWDGIKLGVLCGTVVIIPTDAKAALEQAVGENKIRFVEIPGTWDYVQVEAVGNAHFLTGAVTSIFIQGAIQVLIGTQSLLGEGWDAPCINSLILASFVGSYMLSNQMRGRAIRVMKGQPEKASNVWHLICVPKEEETISTKTAEEISTDFALLTRRMENFMGLHYEKDVIESGMSRLSIIKEPFDAKQIDSINEQMKALSMKRSELKQRWMNAVAQHKKMEIVEETELEPKEVGMNVQFAASLAKSIGNGAIALAAGGSLLAGLFGGGALAGLVLGGVGIATGVKAIREGKKASSLSNSKKRLESVGKGILGALKEKGALEEKATGVSVENDGGNSYFISLEGGSSRDKQVFSDCVKEFYQSIENQRYLLANSKKRKQMGTYYCVPELFSKKKEDAIMFANHVKAFIGDGYEPFYTRTEEGRKVLMEGRMYALANREGVAVTKKRVKSK